MLDQLLGSAKDSIVQDLQARLGLNADKAGTFLHKALGVIEGALHGGKLDLASLAKGNISDILSKLHLGTLSGPAGGPEKARTGMEAILGQLVSAVKRDPGHAEEMLHQLAGHKGVVGQVADVASKLFKKH